MMIIVYNKVLILFSLNYLNDKIYLIIIYLLIITIIK